MILTLDRIINTAKFLPPVSRDSKDMQEVQRIASIELQLLWNSLCDVYLNQWLDTMTEYGLSQWETIFNVMPLIDDSIDDRRQRIYRLIRGERPYTLRSYQRMLNTIWGKNKVTADVVYNKYELWLNVDSNLNYDLDNIYNFTDELVPKNLAIMLRNEHTGGIQSYIGGVALQNKVETINCNDVIVSDLQGINSMGGIVSVIQHVLEI